MQEIRAKRKKKLIFKVTWETRLTESPGPTGFYRFFPVRLSERFNIFSDPLPQSVPGPIGRAGPVLLTMNHAGQKEARLIGYNGQENSGGKATIFPLAEYL